MDANYRRRVIMHEDFDRAMTEMQQALAAEGMETVARTDLRDRFRHTLCHDWHNLRRCELIEAWSPRPAVQAYEKDPDTAALLPASFVVAELTNGDTAVTASEPLSWMQWDLRLRANAPGLVTFATDQVSHVAHVMARLEHAPMAVGPHSAAA
jgi:uncharacterized protein (DUF302 family)